MVAIVAAWAGNGDDAGAANSETNAPCTKARRVPVKSMRRAEWPIASALVEQEQFGRSRGDAVTCTPSLVVLVESWSQKNTELLLDGFSPPLLCLLKYPYIGYC